MAMTPEAKRHLSNTIRGLRTRLLTDLGNAFEATYRLSVRTQDAGLSEAALVRRKRLREWEREQERCQAGAGKQREAKEFRLEAVKQASYTLLNRIVILKLMEGTGLRTPAVVTGAWDSQAYKDFRQIAPALVRDDESEGYAFLLRLVFEELAEDLPGLFGPAGIADLVPVPPSTLRHVIEELDDKQLESCWTDDMTLGWVYQYWNDPEREALDAKLNAGGKVEPHEIASKTQMFTERYMVDWLLQNSLGPMWLAMCRKHGWTPEVESDGTLDRLEQRRIEWRAKRDSGEVSLAELMPLHTDAERHWAYYVPQPIPDDAVEHAAESVRDLKILDPAVGSGHFLVEAFELLVPLYREEAHHRGESGQPQWSDRAIVERILERNLHGIDIDPRAVQIAAAALWLKAQSVSREARPRQLNLVASNLRLSALPDNDPALVELRRQVERDAGIPSAITDTVLNALRGADYLGSLLRVDAAVEAALTRHEQNTSRASPTSRGLFKSETSPNSPFDKAAMRATLLERLELFLKYHSSGDDLGLRLRGQQLTAGVRFVRLLREGMYDLVVGNPPYQNTSKLVLREYLDAQYSTGKADLYAAFLVRGHELAKPTGSSALLTMRNWLFIKQYEELRRSFLQDADLRIVGDFGIGAFDEVPNDILSVAVCVFTRSASHGISSIAVQPTPVTDRAYDRERTYRKRAATLTHCGTYRFVPAQLSSIELWPLVYWWSKELLSAYIKAPKLGTASTVTAGAQASPRSRFLFFHWEFSKPGVLIARTRSELPDKDLLRWVPYIGGGQGRKWIEPLMDVIDWRRDGLMLKVWHEWKTGTVSKRVAGQSYYFKPGVSATAMGHTFQGRMQRFLGIPSEGNPAVYGCDRKRVVLSMNSSTPSYVLQCFNPGTAFEVGDVKRLPVFPVIGIDSIWAILEHAFARHESHREPSVEFLRTGPSPWRYAQEWAQTAVDRPESEPLPPYVEELDPEPPTDHVSFALGVALGRFGANGEGTLDPTTDDLSRALPAGICFLDGTLENGDTRDSLGNAASTLLHETWNTHGPSVAPQSDLRTWLRLRFFADVHRQMYDNKPIHWPLSSARKTYVAWVNIHRMNEQTLRVLLADHLYPAMARLDGELTDLRSVRDGADGKASRRAEKRFAQVQAWREELASFISAVSDCSEKGPPPTGQGCPEREVDARYTPVLDDGVMVNSAALSPLLDPQWNKPKTWWKEMALAKGKKDYDWSHLAMRYWPTRADKKCQEDPSLGVAHGCFWRYHPARAWAWELRLQDEIGPEFRIEEASYRGDDGHEEHRRHYLADHPEEALAAVETEVLRRKKKQKALQTELQLLEAGLWPAAPHLCLDLELRLTRKQGVQFRLAAPDEEPARQQYLDDNPPVAAARTQLLRELGANRDLFGWKDDSEDAGPDETDIEDADQEPEDEE